MSYLKWCLRTLIVAMGLWISASGAQQNGLVNNNAGQEIFSPAHFDEKNGAINFAADPRLDLEGTGSVEIGITLKLESNDNEFPQAMTLLSHEGSVHTTFRLQIGGAGTMLGVYNGVKGKALRYDFTVGGYFQIGLSLRNSEISVYVNGENIGKLPLGFGSIRELPLIVGGQSDSRDSFLGQIHFVRFWDIHLSRKHYRQVDGYPARPEGADWMTNHLQAYTEFTNQRTALNFGSPINPDSVLTAGLAGRNSGGTFFSLPLPGGANLLEIGATSESGRLSTVYLSFIDELGGTFVRSVGAADSQANANNTAIKFDSPLAITGMTTGEAIDGSLQNVVFHFADGSTSDLLGARSQSPVKQRIDIPPGTDFSGLIGVAGDHVQQIGLSYDAPLPISDVSGRWVSRDSGLPYKSPDSRVGDPGLNGLHGNYFNPMDVMVMRTKHGGRDLDLLLPSGANTFRLTDGTGVYRDGSGTGLEFLSNEEAVIGDGWNNLIKVPPYPDIDARDSSFNDFSGTFNLDLQIPFTSHIFHSYDIGHIDPENLQDPTPMRKPVFKEPAPNSREFYTSYQKIVPFGLLHYPDIREKSRKMSRSIGSANDYAEEMSHTIGFSIGVPKVASFGLSSTVKQRMENQRNSKTQFTITRDVRTDRALIVDERYMELDPEFRRRIEDMATQIRFGQKANYSHLIREYGTHFAFALTVGTVSLDTVHFSSSAYKELYEKGKSMEVNASATVRGVKLGGEYKNSNDMSQAFNKEMEQQSENFSAVGRENELVPVFLDLRRLSRLLQAPYFDDVLIVEKMAADLYNAIDAYVASFPEANSRPEDIWEPYFFNVAITNAISDSDKNFTVDGDPVVAAGPNNFFGDFVISGPSPNDTTVVKKLFKGRGQTDGDRLDLGNTASKQVMLSASEICGSSNSPAASVTIGGNFSMDFDDSGDGSGALDVSGHGMRIVFRNLKQKGNTFKHRVSNDGILPLRIMLGASVELLPDLDGNIREMPVCP